ncbi:hypothetical protein L9W80_00065 [Vibrio aestuarianus]|uniref:hypothetical protein n=1 Tax=Vibrio aestuarianus TaxID=28171 RepID=UPI00237D271B|nr:hypothetical protein [Vibrio aestuarianus]MDE1348536.1 hypothetical protein [Vibrio aestuarianus]
MLWTVNKPQQSGLYWLDEVHKGFYRALFAGRDFDDCFPNEFKPVLEASGKTNEYFQAVYDLYLLLEADHQDSFKAIFDNHLNFTQAYSDAQFVVLSPNIQAPNTTEHSAIWKAVKTLGGYLYNTTIGLPCYAATRDTITCMNAHYEEYVRLNGVVCCFCGTEEMMEQRIVEPDEGAISDDEKQWRASYDHYLPKKHYPFLAVDFNNLVPCCQKCNEKAKGELDVLHCEGVRTLAFDPYIDLVPVALNASYDNTNGTFLMKIDIADTADQIFEKADTWNRTFQVLPRVNQRLKQFDGSWLAPVLCSADDAVQARDALTREARRCNCFKKSEREAYYKSLCFNEIVNKSDSEIRAMLDTVDQIYGPRSL